MADLSKWAPSDMLEPVRRFLDGDLTMASSIKVEQFQDGNTLVVRAEVPGIDPDRDVDVSVSGGMLHIRAEREEKSEHKSKDGYRSEFRYGSFTRSVALPPGAKEEDITASYKDGVLEVRAPAPAAAPAGETSKKIRVDRG
ncbi:Hsp20/alpha crystallin family protein [Arthrobacter sp. B3I4]|uniref:Hsp20/alpha crystallin family protein n=1 Tax=Arthrobacter sp. B3I4 TaxID=3042267 RepID=UPI002788C42A|nr:Hsp20/alpha crystallin family protein [Arthrobacter sp. B3I4]MDQ0756488.1 HSP20 family protein [Arthrobacter sp. B3I4]